MGLDIFEEGVNKTGGRLPNELFDEAVFLAGLRGNCKADVGRGGGGAVQMQVAQGGDGLVHQGCFGIKGEMVGGVTAVQVSRMGMYTVWGGRPQARSRLNCWFGCTVCQLVNPGTQALISSGDMSTCHTWAAGAMTNAVPEMFI